MLFDRICGACLVRATELRSESLHIQIIGSAPQHYGVGSRKTFLISREKGDTVDPQRSVVNVEWD